VMHKLLKVLVLHFTMHLYSDSFLTLIIIALLLIILLCDNHSSVLICSICLVWFMLMVS
jgi:hypothetical protein